MHNLSPFLVPISMFVMIGVTVIFTPIARAWARRMDANTQQGRVPPELNARLERMEQAIDAIATEVERIGEGQRFTTNLLASRAREASALPGRQDAP